MNNEVLLSNIRELCKKNNITVAHLEKLMGMGAGTISRWNKASPSFDKIVSIARYFQISIDQLAGYTVDGKAAAKPNEKILKVIDYLRKKTIEDGTGDSFWHDYKQGREIDMLIAELPCMKAENKEMCKLLYAYDGKVYFLLEVIYLLNDSYDYETQIRLYLVPKDKDPYPILQCSDKMDLQGLYIAAARQLEIVQMQREAKEEVDLQIERILEEYGSINE